jgi:L-lysine exporter family protein LysE/ArgO
MDVSPTAKLPFFSRRLIIHFYLSSFYFYLWLVPLFSFYFFLFTHVIISAMIAAFAHGFILALGLILPLGPQNAFVFSQGAAQPRWLRAIPVAVTAALCDTLLILLAVLGVSVAVLAIPWFRTALLAAGIVFLTVVGWLTWRSDDADDDRAAEAAQWPVGRQVTFAVSISLLNPHAILDTIGVIGTSSLSYSGPERTAFTAACVINSWLWFFGLMAAGRLAGQFGNVRKWLNRASAIVMWLSALYLIASLVGELPVGQ